MKIKLPLLISLLSLLSPACAYAVGAKSGLLTTRQPDGSPLHIELRGNEFGHIAYSADGYPLTSDADGFYVFADIDTEGRLAATNLRASDPEARNSETQLRLERLKSSDIEAAILQSHQSRRLAKKNLPGLMSASFPLEGEQRALVILVEFADNAFSVDNPNDYFSRMLNESGFSDNGATGSARDYFIDNSCGKFSPQFDVYGPVKLPNDMKYYGANDRWGNDSNPQEMAIHACQALEGEVSFSLYDANSDGIIDNVFIYYAGYGEADGGGANTIWPHSTRLSLFSSRKYIFDGVQLDRYACTNELMMQPERDRTDGIGTFCHEFSHVLGLPDLYATSTINLSTPGIWDVMDNGSYNNLGMTPPALSSFERSALGWLEPTLLRYSDCILEPLLLSNKAFFYANEKGNEFFLFENRQQQGWDSYLPGHGMLIWHIDFNSAVWNSNTVNDNIWHQHVDLVEADNLSGIESRAGDAFPGPKNVTEFARYTSPSFSFWNYSEEIQLSLRKIRESEEGNISFSVLPLSFVDDEEDEPEEVEPPAPGIFIAD